MGRSRATMASRPVFHCVIAWSHIKLYIPQPVCVGVVLVSRELLSWASPERNPRNGEVHKDWRKKNPRGTTTPLVNPIERTFTFLQRQIQQQP